MAQQTAVEWLINQLSKIDTRNLGNVLQIHEQAKEMEREQHNNSWVDGNNTQRCNSTKETNDCFDNYYNETYGK